MKRVIAVAAAAALSSCRMTPTPPPVPVQGAHGDVSALAGEWTGSYWSKATGRHGTIRFMLPEHADTGYGEVQITFSPSIHLSQEASSVDYPKNDPDELLSPVPAIIGITVVRIEHDRARGSMEPYWDPDCECRAQTVFEGKVNFNRIDGTFSTRRQSDDRRILTGEWRVDREH